LFQRDHLQFVLEGGGCLEHASIKPKALTDGEGFEGLSAV